MLVQTDSRRRITLPSNLGIKPGDAVDLEVLDDGRILIVPVEAIPKHQLWAWTVENKAAITASLADPRPSAVVANMAEAKTTAKRWSGEG
ncbi:MAG: AbrB family transcriptional regulator [Desulfuromonadales bacterium GWD2_61_12]|nr:MAG: AbrB family transcriptional regulator [Desulfuromonadales bacterium GWC2_61_20]OGR34646.1 MAG: AbrB family transcriptional regulator [Desulfuromonadales bacterium GWD2_61_12]HAD03235.1 AbrB family transcriptional regulator [Desulfuromonas sp.]HBT82554.1 AbrB family transcriptional regulator [Desulfuromonas sp.]